MSRMLLVDPRADAVGESHVAALPRLLEPRDVLVVNDAATLPASLRGTLRGQPVEVRLLEGPYDRLTRAVLFGAGDYRTATELRPPPPEAHVGDEIDLGAARLRVADVSALSPRLVSLRWPDDPRSRFALLYRVGRPVQYSYEPLPLALWDVQTMFASRPWAVEMPSAARPLSGALLSELARRGVRIARLTEAAGLSATGDAAIDAALPLPERYAIPAATVAAVEEARQRGGRVVAVGTSVVRALEDAASRHGRVVAGEAVAELVLTVDATPRVVDGLLTGIHAPGESHYRLLSAFARGETLGRAVELARAKRYRPHEFGEAMLLLPGALRTRARTTRTRAATAST